MEPFELGESLFAGFQEQVVSVRQHNVAVDVLRHGRWQKSLHCSFGAYGHIHRRTHYAVSKGHFSGTAPVEGLQDFEDESWALFFFLSFLFTIDFLLQFFNFLASLSFLPQYRLLLNH